jgi:hypothetical protein
MSASFDNDDDSLGPPQLDVVVPEIKRTLLTFVFQLQQQNETTTCQQPQQQCGEETVFLYFYFIF